MSIQSFKTTTFIFQLSILGVGNMVAPQAIASDAIGPGDSNSKWVTGLSLGTTNNPYIGESTERFVSPTIRYNGERFFVRDTSLNLFLTKSLGFSGGLTIALDSGFLSDDDEYKNNDKLLGIDERDATAMGGIYINHDSDLGRLSFNALSDMGDEHDGRIARLSYTFDFTLGDWNINPELGVLWADDKYVNHHVGVSSNEATASRFEYRGEATANTFAGIRARYEITNNWDINIETGVTKIGSGFADSSIVEDDRVYQASVGINYNF